MSTTSDLFYRLVITDTKPQPLHRIIDVGDNVNIFKRANDAYLAVLYEGESKYIKFVCREAFMKPETISTSFFTPAKAHAAIKITTHPTNYKSIVMHVLDRLTVNGSKHDYPLNVIQPHDVEMK